MQISEVKNGGLVYWFMRFLKTWHTHATNLIICIYFEIYKNTFKYMNLLKLILKFFLYILLLNYFVFLVLVAATKN